MCTTHTTRSVRRADGAERERSGSKDNGENEAGGGQMIDGHEQAREKEGTDDIKRCARIWGCVWRGQPTSQRAFGKSKIERRHVHLGGEAVIERLRPRENSTKIQTALNARTAHDYP